MTLCVFGPMMLFVEQDSGLFTNHFRFSYPK
jgi:hypothetical protein